MPIKSFPSLHTHTMFSTLDAVPSPSAYFERCQELGMKKIAFTDHGSLGSLAEATIESKKFDVQPIMGLEGYFVPSVKKMNEARSLKMSKEEIKKVSDPYHIILLAKNEIGFKNLIFLNNFAWTKGFYYRPKFDFHNLFKHKEGLICSSACQSGIISKLILNKKPKKALKVAKRMKEEFGDDFYLELQLIDLESQDFLNGELIKLGKELDIPHTLTNDVHFLRKGDHKIQKILMEVATKGAFSYDAPENYLKSLDEWKEIRDERKSIPTKIFDKAIDNCFSIADECNFTVPIGNLYFPTYNHPEHFMFKKFPEKDKETFFYKMLFYRARKMLGTKLHEKIYKERLVYEFKTLKALGGLDYFLICDDLLNYVRNEGAFSLIRGSANGSLIAFVFGFGLIDPIKHGILFERFVSKYRSLNDVDIDIDVRSEFRSKAVNYLKKKYGDDRVVSVGTYNRMQMKAAIKDVTRVLKDRLDKRIAKTKSEKKAEKLAEKQKKYLFYTINKITSPMEGDLTFEQAKEQYNLFGEWYKQNKTIAEKYIRPVVGNIRNVSIHPAGVVLTPGKVDELLPIRTQPSPSDKSVRVISTVWENSHTSREDLNEIGVMILDILAVKTLSIVSEVIDLVKIIKKKEIDLYKLDLEDKKTIDMFNQNEVIGVFQFSGGSASQIIKTIEITEFNDLIVINALARPGALAAGADKSFAKRKADPSKIKYAHHSLSKILNDSSGVLVFSEHILRTANEFAGMHPKRADELRKIIKGKNPALFKAYKKEFIKGASKKWKKEKDIKVVANNIWKNFSEAGSYLFPRGHAASYALLGFICQYLKVHYPTEFFASHLRYQPQNKYGDVKHIAESIYKIKFLMPNINKPKLQFEPLSKNRIRWPLTALKSIGDKAVESIVTNAPFISFKDFFDRVNKRVCNKRVVENLILAGAFKDFGNKRAVLLEYKKLRKDKDSSLPLSFSSKENMIIAIEDVYGFETLSLRKLYKEKIEIYLESLISFSEFYDLEKGDTVVVFGRISRLVEIVTKKGDKMAFSSIKDGKGEFKVTLFPDTYELVKGKFEEGKMVILSGVKNVWNKESSIVLETDKSSFKSGSWVKFL